jgi:hypothetical protein
MCFQATVDPALIGRVVEAAAAATALAPTKAARRRIRQRLHKKLGPILPHEMLQEVMDKFKSTTLSSDQSGSGEMAQVVSLRASSHPGLPPFYLPSGLPTLLTSSVQLPSATQWKSWALVQSPRENTFTERSDFNSRLLAPMVEAPRVFPAVRSLTEDFAVNRPPESFLERALTEGSWGGTAVPVEKTFIHFRTAPAPCAVRRALSAK